MNFKLKNPKADEKILAYLKPHWIHLLGVILFFLMLAAIPPILFYFFQFLIGGLLDNQIIFAISVMVGTIYYLFAYAISFSAFLDYELDFWVVTNYRIIATEQKGLFQRSFAEHLIERIQDVSSHQKGLMQTILDYGDVEIQTAGEQEKFVFNDVSHPEEKVSMINQVLSQKIQRPLESKAPSGQP